ncbi:MAG: tRNA lysidine(34) synthetase TilS [Muribaculaceae bacterium]|nr:tRNA lysidine(34) synthetase TilS [Muribaculaceae bacterium]
MSLLERVKAFSSEHRLFPPGSKVGMGLSGGADSVALLRVLLLMGIDVKAYHCNFHLRGDESDRDEAFCRSLCSEAGVELEVRDFDVPARMKATGESVEMACRALRYEWWDALGVDRFAVAHHADDNVETLFLNMMRGSGLRGLRGMRPANGKVVRPLLCVTRREILDFLDSVGQDYVTDSTNASNDFRRNRLRNTLLPLLEELFPGAVAGIGKTQSILLANDKLFERLVDEHRRTYLSPYTGVVDIARLSSDFGDDAPEMLYEILAPDGLTIKQCQDIFDSGATHSGRQFHCRDGRVYVVEREKLTPYFNDALTARVVSLDEYPFGVEEIGRGEFEAQLPASKNVMFLDADILRNTPQFVLRPWAKGDRIAPFGLKGGKLVSDIYNDNKIGIAERNKYPVLEADGKILWVCGLRASRHYAVTPQTGKILRVEYFGL